MNITNLFSIALKALSNNKTRSLLTMLGIIIGISSVIIMLALGSGTKESVRSEISGMGSNMIMISPYADRQGGVRQDASAMQTLKESDLQSLKNDTKYLSAVSPNVSASGQLIAGNNNYPASITGCDVGYLEIRQLEIEDGSMFTDHDVRTSAKVCIIGKTIADNLFPDQDPIGQTIRLEQVPFRIIGTLVPKGINSMGQDQDEVVLAPYSTIQKRLLASNYFMSILASATDESLTEKAIDEISNILRHNHKIKEGETDNFEVRSMQEIMDVIDSTMSMLTLLLAAIAGISLLVGGIGIMNIMYVSVTERTKEIGLRMSVGARSVDILSQFLIEAILISITGGIIGVILGWLIATLLGMLLGVEAGIQLWSVMLSFGVCTITGVFFGWYPAQKAANLDPIDALRYE